MPQFNLPDDLTAEEKLAPIDFATDDSRVRLLNQLYGKHGPVGLVEPQPPGPVAVVVVCVFLVRTCVRHDVVCSPRRMSLETFTRAAPLSRACGTTTVAPTNSEEAEGAGRGETTGQRGTGDVSRAQRPSVDVIPPSRDRSSTTGVRQHRVCRALVLSGVVRA